MFSEAEIPEFCKSVFLLLLNKDKIFGLLNSEILFSLKIPSYKKLITRFYDVILRNSFFLTRLSNSRIPDPIKTGLEF